MAIQDLHKRLIQLQEVRGSGTNKNLELLKGLLFYCQWTVTDKYLSHTNSKDDTVAQIIVQRQKCCFKV
jgi:hypothetical protein